MRGRLTNEKPRFKKRETLGFLNGKEEGGFEISAAAALSVVEAR